MTCAACKGNMMRKRGDLDLRVKGELYIAHNVCFEECSNCGELVLDPETSDIIYKRIKLKQYSKQKMDIPVLDLAMGI